MNDHGAPLGTRITGHTAIVGVIGWPIAHTVSPPMHNAAFDALELDWCYVAYPVEPTRLRQAIDGLIPLGIRGVNVTVPHKQAMLPLVDELTPAAQVIGAVNTVIIDGARLRGHNTDAGGFLRALRETGFDPAGCRAALMGAGGAARSVAYALASVGAEVVILNRTVGRAVALADEMQGVSSSASLAGTALSPDALKALGGVDLIVNATSLGMWPHVEASPWPDSLPIPGNALVFDLVYNPRETLLIRQALTAGARAIDGLRMLVHQGAEAFELWTGVAPPADIMYSACTAILGGD